MTAWPSCPSASLSDAETSASPPVLANGCASEATISTDSGVASGTSIFLLLESGNGAATFLGAVRRGAGGLPAARGARGRLTFGTSAFFSCFFSAFSALFSTLFAVFFVSAFLTGCGLLTFCPGFSSVIPLWTLQPRVTQTLSLARPSPTATARCLSPLRPLPVQLC